MKILRNIRNISSDVRLVERKVGWGAATLRVTRQPGCWNNNNAATAAVMCWDKLIILSDIFIASFIRRSASCGCVHVCMCGESVRLYQVQSCRHLSCLISFAFKSCHRERRSWWWWSGSDFISLIWRTKIKCAAHKLLKVTYFSKSKFGREAWVCFQPLRWFVMWWWGRWEMQ